MIGHIEHLSVHGQYIGVAQGREMEWTLEPYKQPPLEVLVGQRFPTREALLTAIDEALGAEIIARMEATAAAHREREAHYWETAKQEAIARSFTGEKFDEQRPIKDVAKAIRADLLAAMVQGNIPPDRYRVTVRQQRYDTPRIYVYAWAAHEIRETVEQLTQVYNRCEGHPRHHNDDGGTGDEWHFRTYVEWPSPWNSRRQSQHGSYEEYEAACKLAQAEAEAWGKTYHRQASITHSTGHVRPAEEDHGHAGVGAIVSSLPAV